MERNLKIFISTIILFLLISGNALARMSEANDSSVEVELDLGVVIPPRVFLQVGSKGTMIDTVAFEVTDFPKKMPVVQSRYAPQIIIVTNSDQGATLTANSSTGLRGEAATIPFNVISWEGTGDFAGSNGTFNGSSNQQIWSASRKGAWKGGFVFQYKNISLYPAGLYSGTVTYTIAPQ